METARGHRRPTAAALDLIAVAVLGGFAWSALGYLVRNDLFTFADNLGGFVRLWWLLDVAIPAGEPILGWNPYWWAGWPEWQFYPPGYGLAGLAIRILTLGRLQTAEIYQLLLFIAYLAPAISAFVGLRGLGLGRSVGLVAGAFLLIFPDLYGGVGGVMIGGIGDRLGLGLAPLAWFAGVQAVERRQGFGWLAAFALLLAVITLLHPFRLLLPVMLVALTALFPAQPRLGVSASRRLRHPLTVLVAGVTGALFLVSFWLVPYLVHSRLTTPVLRAGIDTLGFWLLGGRLPFFLLLAAWGVIRATTAATRERGMLVALTIAPLATLAFMLVNWLVLVERLGFTSLDPIRFIEDIYLSVLLLAAVGAIDFVQTGWARVASVSGRRTVRAVPILVTLVLGFLTLQPFPRWLEYYRTRPGGEPRFLSEAIADYRLIPFWDVLRANPGGRVLVTSSQFRMRQTGETFPTYLMSLIPVVTGRPIVGGTFQHWAPVATYYWEGLPLPALMKDRTDLKDDQSIFGLPWREMDEPKLLAALRQLDITDLVATDYDLWTRTYLDRSPSFKAVYNDPQFVVYRVQNYQPTLIEADPSQAIVAAARTGKEVRLDVASSTAGATVLLKQTYYPLWQPIVSGALGPVTLQSTDIGLTRIVLPEGNNYTVQLRWTPGPAETSGLILTGLGGLGTVGLALAEVAVKLGQRRRSSRTVPAGASAASAH